MEITIILLVIVFSIYINIRQRKRIQRRKKIHSTAYDILKEEALCHALKNHSDNPNEQYLVEEQLLILLEGIEEQKQLSYILSLNNTIILGRNPKISTVTISDPSVTSKHCEIFLANKIPYGRDSNSTNGTSIKRFGRTIHIKQGEMIRLKNRDIIEVGSVSFRITIFKFNRKFM